MVPVKSSVVAGLFYPADPGALRAAVRGYLAAAGAAAEAPEAAIAPHAGFLYSGPVAASAYARLRGRRGHLRRVVLLGPSHYCDFEGLATSAADAFATPLGEVPVDREGVEAALRFPRVAVREEAFAREHSLEVHLPFLQEALDAVPIVPLLTGAVAPEAVAEVIEALWDRETLVVVSSDLSHFHPSGAARKIDDATSRAIEECRPEEIGPGRACGHTAIKGLMEAARRRGLRCRAVDLRNSADTAGLAGEVVGYGAFLYS